MKSQALWAILCAVACCWVGLAAGVSDPSEANSLAVFKQATGNPPALANWQGNDPCGDNWLGVTCTAASGNTARRVTQLQLPNTGLSGNIPRVISQLSQLQLLDLSSNKLQGPIPVELGNLTKLQTLDLHSNAIVSTMDPWLVQLTSLTTLDLSSNQIWGYLPAGITALTKLQTINLASNNIAGPILPALGQLTNLTMLVLYDNKLNGPVPPELGNLTNLYGLLLHNNSLSGTVPPELANCKSLGWLFLHNNFLTGLVPIALTQEPQLVARYDGNPLCQTPSNAVYCLVNPKAAPPAPPQAMSPVGAALMAAGVGGANGNGNGNASCVENCGGGGFHWTTTDTIVTAIFVPLGIVVLVILAWYLKRQCMARSRGPLIAGGVYKSTPAGSGPAPMDPAKPEYTFDAKGGSYYPMAGTPSQTSTESIDNKSDGSGSRLLKPVADFSNGGMAMWRQGTIGEVLKRNAERASVEGSVDAGTPNGNGAGNGNDYPLSSPDADTPTPGSQRSSRDRFRLDGATGNGNVPLLFTFKELQGATQNFSPTLLIGEGGFGRVYYGVLEGREVAVKRLEKVTAQPGKHGEKQFRVEVDMMSRLKHPNLLEFIGYCADRYERALVYPLMVNQSLFRRLHERNPGTAALDCHQRMTIAYQAARALAYLHDEVSPPVIHRDFNSSNVLLDAKLDAVVSDFGLAKLVSDDSGQSQTTKLFGTMGYMAPEYLHGHVTDKNDVYSFGVVLLELISGRRAVISKDLDIVQWAAGYTGERPIGPLARMADPQIQDQFPADALQWAVELAAECIQAEPRRRPRMADVARGLEVILQAIRRQQPTYVAPTPNTPTSPASLLTPTDVITLPAGFSMTRFLGSLKKP